METTLLLFLLVFFCQIWLFHERSPKLVALFEFSTLLLSTLTMSTLMGGAP